MRSQRQEKAEEHVAEHPFVATLREIVALKRQQYSIAVREGRMDPKLARSRYDRITSALEFMEAMAVRYDGERAYEAGNIAPATTGAMANADCQARTLWERWRPDVKQKEEAE